MKKVLAIVGPTGTGKSELAIYLAKKFSGEIINCDAFQVYKYLDIGTAKPSLEERKKVPHHLFDVFEPCEESNAAQFSKLAEKVIEEVLNRKNLPILVGGTGLYLRFIEYGFFELKIPETLKREVREKVKKNPEEAYRELEKLDPEYAKKIGPKDWVRIGRALEVIYATGKPFSYFHKIYSFEKNPRYSILKIGLILPRKVLYERINQRVYQMISQGWIREVKELIEKYPIDCPAFKAIGYRYLALYLKGKLSLEDAIYLIQRDTRRYAKRQITWFKKEKGIHWFHPEEREKIEKLVQEFCRS